MVAKRLIEERSREFLAVRKVAKDYENITRGLERNQPAVPPQGTQDEQKQVAQWKKYIEWEKFNPLRNEDLSFVAKRVMFGYEQCLLVLSYHPDIWFEAANYLQETSAMLAEKSIVALSKQFAEEVSSLYERAINSFMKNNMLIYFSYADFEESRLNYDKAKKIYDKCIENQDMLNPSLVKYF
jgi:cleavage stimulation factor subunit 3